MPLQPREPVSELVHAVLAAAAHRPDSPAVADTTRELTYFELSQEASAVTQGLQSLMTDDHLVAVRTGRSTAAVVAMLAIRMAGRGYVPIDPTLPTQRAEFILDDSGARLIVTDRALPGETAVMQFGDLMVVARSFDEVARSEVPADTAYVIYTSGSTGAPKGCIIREGGLMQMLDSVKTVIGTSAADTWSVFHSFSFDASVYEIWAPLTCGGSARIVPDDVRHDPETFWDYVDREGVTILSLTSSVLSGALDTLDGRVEPNAVLRHLILGGEKLRPRDIVRLYDSGLFPTITAWNLWGITEGTVHCSYKRITRDMVDPSAPSGTLTPIGVPLPHLRISVVPPSDSDESGELVVTGEAVAWGYLNRPELTTSRFTLDGETRLADYRTGDWGRVQDGELMYEGRRDDQVKIRGFRIELGEIEHALLGDPRVSSAACMVGQHPGSGRDVLIAAVQTADEEVSELHLLRALRATLPGYMVPLRIGIYDRLPVNSNGKIDRQAIVHGLLQEER